MTSRRVGPITDSTTRFNPAKGAGQEDSRHVALAGRGTGKTYLRKVTLSQPYFEERRNDCRGKEHRVGSFRGERLAAGQRAEAVSFKVHNQAWVVLNPINLEINK
jgi:hypothetical protein